MANTEAVLLKSRDAEGFLTLTLNRPGNLNALNPELLFALDGTVKEADETADLKGIILTGAGGHFCAGGDVFIMKEAVDARDIDALSPFLSILEQTALTLFASRLPTLCLLDGIVAGAGIGLALSADIRVATDRTRCHFAFPTLGAVPDAGASYLLPRLIGYRRAMEFYIRNEPLDAETGLGWGLFTEVVPAEAVPERLAYWKEKMAALASKGFRLSKELFRQSLFRPLADQVDAEYFAQLTAMKSGHFYGKVTELTTKKDGKKA